MKKLFIAIAAVMVAVATTAAAQGIVHAKFNDAGEALQPNDWRSWMFVGAVVTPNALNGGEAPFPEFHNVYIEPSAFEHYVRTGEWPEGT